MRTIDLIDNDKKDVKWIIDMFQRDLLYVDETFQRRYVWLEKHQIKLIETILLGYSVPEIYLWATNTDATTGDTKYSIVDGQQRLGAVLKFISNNFRLRENYLDDANAVYANKKFEELPDEEKRLIWRYPFSMRVIKQEVDRHKIVKMFLRLNFTDKSLNPQELRNAEFEGLFLKLSQEIADLDFWKTNKVFSTNDYRRMMDIQFASSLLIFLRMGIEAETTQESINKAYDLFNDKYEEYDKDKECIKKMLSEVTKMIEHNKDNLKLLSKTTHLYTILIVAYNALILTEGFTKDNIERFTRFAYCYVDGNEEGLDQTEANLINQYRVLTGEGTQRKQNRINRVNILKQIMKID